ncbi:MAG: hypothetical protein IJZ70_06995 [Bacteroidales bacterium]|nr:hypothetical protein [Bacteroidales bacterium]
MTDNIRVVRLTQDYQFKSFDCGNQDLNDFLLSDSKPYLKKLLSVTYILETAMILLHTSPYRTIRFLYRIATKPPGEESRHCFHIANIEVIIPL